MDPLTQQLLQRAMGQGAQPPQGAQPKPVYNGGFPTPPPPPAPGPGLGGPTQGPSQLPIPTGPQSNPAPQAPSTPQAQTPPLMLPGAQQPPAVPPASGGKTNTPPEAQRFINAQRMIQAYRNGWSPNPLIVQAQGR